MILHVCHCIKIKMEIILTQKVVGTKLWKYFCNLSIFYLFQVTLGQLYYQGGRGVPLNHEVCLYSTKEQIIRVLDDGCWQLP